ncbi:MAG: hypothetical protein LUM44_23515 [Pyrinomonadaceae bacterium]|nr:hypothetical protein [Pyrinomonadaceae bacterium]
MNRKEYESSDDYKQNMEYYLKTIEKRDQIAELLKFAPPERVAEIRGYIAEADADIEKMEVLMAEMNELFERSERADKEADEAYKSLNDILEKSFIFCKHFLPEEFKPLETDFLNGLTPQEAEEFLDRIAVRETNEFDQIVAEITGNKEWRKALKNHKPTDD